MFIEMKIINNSKQCQKNSFSNKNSSFDFTMTIHHVFICSECSEKNNIKLSKILWLIDAL